MEGIRELTVKMADLLDKQDIELNALWNKRTADRKALVKSDTVINQQYGSFISMNGIRDRSDDPEIDAMLKEKFIDSIVATCQGVHDELEATAAKYENLMNCKDMKTPAQNANPS
jgi:hypothetical protein